MNFKLAYKSLEILIGNFVIRNISDFILDTR